MDSIGWNLAEAAGSDLVGARLVTESDRIRAYFAKAAWRSTSGRNYLAEERFRLLVSVVTGSSGRTDQLAICDVGCGTGTDLARWHEVGISTSQLAGTELVPERAAAARRNVIGADIRVVDSFDLPFRPGSFDVCTASLVFSTIQSMADRRHLLSEMRRVTRPGGMVIIYDFRIRKPWNWHVTAVMHRQLRHLWRTPDSVHRAAPLLPALEVALRMPHRVRRLAISALPRTHRMWVWRTGAKHPHEHD